MKQITPLANRSGYTREFFAPYYEELLSQPINNDQDMLALLKNNSDIESLAHEAYYQAHKENSRNLLDETIKARYQYFVKEFIPQTELIDKKMADKMLEYDIVGFSQRHPEWALFFKRVTINRDMFNENNITLKAQEKETADRYSTIMSQLTVETQSGESLTISQAASKLSNLDRGIRKYFFEKIIEKRSERINDSEDIFEELLEIRHKISHNAGYTDYLKYIYDSKSRFDYSPDDVAHLCASITQSTQNRHTQNLVIRSEILQIDKLKPYDLHVDINGEEQLNYGKTADELITLARNTITKIDPRFVNYFNKLDESGNLDLLSRTGKRGGGFHMKLPYSKLSFILMNASETIDNFFTLMHEFGHAYHANLARQTGFLQLSGYSIETAEVASMSMECFALEEIKDLYSENDYKRLIKEHCDKIISALRMLTLYEEFQIKVYSKPGISKEEIKTIWTELQKKRSTGLVDWSEYELRHQHSWTARLHLYSHPFYNIEYVFAQLAAVQFWMKYRENKEKALADYTAMLSSGFTKGVRETYQIGGVSFVTEQDELQKIIDFVTTMSKENS